MNLLPVGVHPAKLGLDLGDLGALGLKGGPEAVEAEVKLEQAVRHLEQVRLDLLKCEERLLVESEFHHNLCCKKFANLINDTMYTCNAND